MEREPPPPPAGHLPTAAEIAGDADGISLVRNVANSWFGMMGKRLMANCGATSARRGGGRMKTDLDAHKIAMFEPMLQELKSIEKYFAINCGRGYGGHRTDLIKKAESELVGMEEPDAKND